MKRIGILLKEHYFISMILSGVVGAIIAWVIGWILPNSPVYVENMPQKSLTCKLNYSQKLFEKHTNDERFKISYNGADIAEPYVFNITIENSGSYSIDNSDFKKDFIIDFQGCNKIINAIVENSSNQDVWEEIKNNARFEDTKLVITDFFLNPQEKFTLNIFTDEKPEKIMYSPRIDGIAELTLINTPEKRQQDKDKFLVIMLFSMLCILVGVIIFLIIIARKDKKFREKHFNYIKEIMSEDKNISEEENYNG